MNGSWFHAATWLGNWMKGHDWTGREDAHRELTHIRAEFLYLADYPEEDVDDFT